MFCETTNANLMAGDQIEKVQSFIDLLFKYNYHIMGYEMEIIDMKMELKGWRVRKGMKNDIILFPDEETTTEEFEDYLIMLEL